MRKSVATSFLFWTCLMFSPSLDSAQGGRPIPPGVREADKASNSPVEPPAKFKRIPPDPAVLKQEAEELAKLSDAVPSQMNLVSQGKIPKDLADQLKRIEKLAKHLRSEISQ